MLSTPESSKIQATIEFSEEYPMEIKWSWTGGCPVVLQKEGGGPVVGIICVGGFIMIQTRIKFITILIDHILSFANSTKIT